MTKKTLIQILFFGSIWGILEATIGNLLHYLPTFIAGTIMFPIAAAILYKAYDATKSKASLLYVGIVAVAIKAINFLLPQYSVFKVINPMIFIILESLMFVAVITLIKSDNPIKKYSALPIASISWRLLFVGYMLVNGSTAPYVATFNGAFEFVMLSGLLSGVIGSLFIFALDKVNIKSTKLSTRFDLAFGLLAIAIITTYLL